MKNEQGFSFIELLIVLITIGILVGIIVVTYNNNQAKSRNNIRTADIRTLQVAVEKFYSQNNYYPTLSEMNSLNWRKANLSNLSQSTFKDPSWTPKNKACNVNGQPILLKQSQPGCYGYSPTNNGASCAAVATSCSDYTLSATLEDNKGIYTKRQLD